MPLADIIQKEPLITTPSAHDIASSPQRWETSFGIHVATYFALPEVEKKWSAILNNLLNEKSATGLIYADTGYGKTVTGASLWKTAEERGIVAVPPFIWNSLADLLTATHGWVCYRLQTTRPELIPQLEQKHQAVVEVDEEALAQKFAREDGIPLDQARRLIDRLKADGRLLDKCSPHQLLNYLRFATEILLQSNYKGLLILPDEFELFKQNPDTAQNFTYLKDFIFGVHGERTLPIGCVALTYRRTFADIEIGSSHILARFNKPEGSLIDLEQAYGQTDFAKHLWDNLAVSCMLSPSERKAINSNVLNALGQFLRHTRSRDLMSGPRSVVATFNRAARHYSENNRSYSLFDFCEDYLSGHISFSGQHVATAQAHTQIMALPLVNNEARRKFVKLLCVHPEGIPSALLQAHGISESDKQVVVNELSDYIITKATGPALRCYGEGQGPDPLTELLKQHKVSFNRVNREFHEAAVRGFTNHVFPKIFTRRSGREGWTEETSTDWGIHCCKNLRGSLLREYPDRTLTVDIGTEELVSRSSSESHCFALFILDTTVEASNTSHVRENGLEFRFNLQNPIDSQKIQEDTSSLAELFPLEEITPLRLLSVLDFFDREEVVSQIERDGLNTEVELRKIQILDILIHSFFSPAIKEDAVFASQELSAKFAALPAGENFVEEALKTLIPKHFPEYSAVAVSNGWQRYLGNYVDALGQENTLGKKRGVEPIETVNREIPQLFSVGQITAFQNFWNGVGRKLLRIDEIDGAGNTVAKGIQPRNNNKQVAVYLTPHPFEERIVNLLESSHETVTINTEKLSALKLPDVYKHASKLGYLDEETEALIKVIKARGTADTWESGGIQYLYRVWRGRPFPYLRDKLEGLEKVLSLAESKEFNYQFSDVSSARTLAQSAGIQNDEILQDKLEKELDAAAAHVGSQCKEWLMDAQNALQRQIESLDQLRGGVPQVQEPPTGPFTTEFSPILFQRIQPDVKATCTRLSSEIQGIKENATKTLRQSRVTDSPTQNLETAIRLREEGSEVQTEIERLRKANGDAQALSLLFDRWCVLAKRVADTRVLMTDIPDNRAVRDLIVSLDAVQRTIKASFGTKNLKSADALSSHEHFKTQAEEIADAFDKLKGEIAGDFLESKGRIERELARVIDTPHINVNFNPADSDGSYHDVRAKTVAMLDEFVIDKARDTINTLQSELKGHLRVFEPSDTVRTQSDELAGEIAEVEEKIERIYLDLTPASVEEKLTVWVDALVSIRERGKSVHTQWEEIRRKLTRPLDELSPKARRLLDELPPHETNFTELVMRLIDDGNFNSTKEILECLEELYQGNWVNMTVRGR